MKNRKDAIRVAIPGLMQGCIDLKPHRYENEVYINHEMDVTNLVDFVERKKAEGVHITYFQAFMTAIAKVIYSRPKLNRFVSNRHMYEHRNVNLAFVAKVTLDDKSQELMLNQIYDKEDTLYTSIQKLQCAIEKLRAKKENNGDNKVKKGGANKGADVLANLPNFIRIPIFGIIKRVAEKGKLPASLSKDNIYFSSMIVSNLGSIHCGAIYHNLAEFGTCSGLTAIGEIKPKKIIDKDGNEIVRKFCEFGITLDERIGDGYYFAKSCMLIQKILSNPTLLEEPVGNEVTLD